MKTAVTQLDLICACKLGRIQGGHDSDPRLRLKVLGAIPWSESKKPKSTGHENNLCLNGEGLEGLKRDAVKLALAESGGCVTRAAKRLQISRSAAYDLVSRFALLVLVLAAAGCHQSPEPTVVSGGPVVTNRPAPEVGWPIRYVTNQLPPLPRLKALAGDARQTVASQSVTVQPAPRRSAVSILTWSRPASPVSEFQIYTKAGVKVLTVPAEFNNCTVTGFYPGETPEFYATASFIGEESEPSNTALAVALVPTPNFTPRPRDHVWRYTWRQAVGVTNALQFSTNLTQWSNVARWRGTNGTAAVTVTNRPGFYRVRFENATNAPVTLTQTVTHVLLTWTNAPGATQRLDRLAHAASGSFVPVLTNTVSGTVNVIQPAGAQWRLWKL